MFTLYISPHTCPKGFYEFQVKNDNEIIVGGITKDGDYFPHYGVMVDEWFNNTRHLAALIETLKKYESPT